MHMGPVALGPWLPARALMTFIAAMDRDREDIRRLRVDPMRWSIGATSTSPLRGLDSLNSEGLLRALMSSST